MPLVTKQINFTRVTYDSDVPEGVMLIEKGVGGRWGYETSRYNCEGNYALRIIAMLEMGASGEEIGKVARAGNKAWHRSRHLLQKVAKDA